MAYKLYQVDAFTNKAFGGNPAAVVILQKPQPEAWMQNVAAEMNLSETAFVSPNADPFKRVWNLRWFTPTVEVAMCGHATLATAHIMYTEGLAKPTETLRFETKSGELRAERAEGTWIKLTFPTTPVEPYAIPDLDLLQAALGLAKKPLFTGKTAFDLLIEIESAQVLRDLAPDFSKLAQVQTDRAVIVTARADSDKNDFISRVFAPAAGISEDPVTGSAHCALSQYWAGKLEKNDFKAFQASKRGGVLRVNYLEEKTEFSGQAVTVFKGKLLK